VIKETRIAWAETSEQMSHGEWQQTLAMAAVLRERVGALCLTVPGVGLIGVYYANEILIMTQNIDD